MCFHSILLAIWVTYYIYKYIWVDILWKKLIFISPFSVISRVMWYLNCNTDGRVRSSVVGERAVSNTKVAHRRPTEGINRRKIKLNAISKDRKIQTLWVANVNVSTKSIHYLRSLFIVVLDTHDTMWLLAVMLSYTN